MLRTRLSRSLATHAPSTHILTSVIVNRSPTISRTPTPFEKTFYQYQSRIARALHNPFPHEFYFKQGAPLEAQFNIEERKREEQAFGTLSSFMTDATEANEEAAEMAKEDIEPSAPRISEADKTKDVQSLARQGERNLYLVLKKKDGSWSFPQGSAQKGEFLHQVTRHFATSYTSTHMPKHRRLNAFFIPSVVTAWTHGWSAENQ